MVTMCHQRTTSMPSYQEENGNWRAVMKLMMIMKLMLTIIIGLLIIVCRFFPEAQVSRMDFKPLVPGGESGDPFQSNNGMISQALRS